MLLYDVLKKNKGFTLIEMITVVIIVGVIASIAAPNFIGLFNRTKVNTSLDELVGAIRETQRQAIRLGQSCRVDIDPNTKVITATPSNCLLNNRQIDNDVKIRTNLAGTPPNISFSYKGNTTNAGTIVLSSDLTDTQKCFTISLGLGIMRTGNYTGTASSIDPGDCETQ